MGATADGSPTTPMKPVQRNCVMYGSVSPFTVAVRLNMSPSCWCGNAGVSVTGHSNTSTVVKYSCQARRTRGTAMVEAEPVDVRDALRLGLLRSRQHRRFGDQPAEQVRFLVEVDVGTGVDDGGSGVRHRVDGSLQERAVLGVDGESVLIEPDADAQYRRESRATGAGARCARPARIRAVVR